MATLASGLINNQVHKQGFAYNAYTGMPHTQGIQGNSGNFQVEENLRETQEILNYFLNSG